MLQCKTLKVNLQSEKLQSEIHWDREKFLYSNIIFECTGGMSRESGKFYSPLADVLEIKKNLSKSTVMGWLWENLSFILLSSVDICMRVSTAGNIKKMNNNNANYSTDIEYVCGITINEE